MRAFFISLFMVGILGTALLGCNNQQSAPPPTWAGEVGTVLSTASPAPGQSAWPCSIQLIAASGPSTGTATVGMCGISSPPSGSSSCQITSPLGGMVVGWCLPGSISSPSPVTSASPSVPTIPTPTVGASAGSSVCTNGTTSVSGAPPGVCAGVNDKGESVFTYEVGGIAKTLYIFNKDADNGQQNFTHCPYDNGGTDNIGCDDGIQNAGTNGGANADPYGGFWPPVLMSAQTSRDTMGDTWMSFARKPQILSTDSDPYNGMQQISCNGHPIYTYTADAGALGSKGDQVQSYDNKWVVLTNPCQAPLAMP